MSWLLLLLVPFAHANAPAWRVVDTHRADLDGDGQAETIQLAIDAEKALHLTVRDKSAAHDLDLGVTYDIFGPRTDAQLTLTEVTETGVVFARVHLPGGEYCGSGDSTRYIAWSGGEPVEVLHTWTWADAPVYASREATFHPETRTVTVVETRGEYGHEDDSHETHVTTELAWNGQGYVATARR
ncbi:MAG: hypothetical protein EP330_01915 [Deltaproteobacteria bacterium]|nr:MAG: hypothetical protein EP330_01915 [Deltaproteobacteria bacterium]